ncbi:hypothetical protein Tco_0769893 [Tanacetum coccineum]|uniref:Uncharacterized protein n=1 Tax=Tanacetum coccineum TaxID=301880 RepID=A0ABQ4ZBM1_9ASTR
MNVYQVEHRIVAVRTSSRSNVAIYTLPIFLYHSEAHHGVIPSEDPKEEACRDITWGRHHISPSNVPASMESGDQPRCEVGESSAAATTRQPGPTMARRSIQFLDTISQNRESRFTPTSPMPRIDRAAVRAEIERLRRVATSGSVRNADDRATRHIMRIQALEARARDDTLEDTASRRYRSCFGLAIPVDMVLISILPNRGDHFVMELIMYVFQFKYEWWYLSHVCNRIGFVNEMSTTPDMPLKHEIATS